MWKTVNDCFWLCSCRACDRCTLSMESKNKAPKKSPCLGSTQIKLLLLARHWTRRNEAISRPKPRASKLSGKKTLLDFSNLHLFHSRLGWMELETSDFVEKCKNKRTHVLFIYVHFFSMAADILDNSAIGLHSFVQNVYFLSTGRCLHDRVECLLTHWSSPIRLSRCLCAVIS